MALKDEILAVITTYRNKFDELSMTAAEKPSANNTVDRFSHAYWLCDLAESLANDDRYELAMLYLGRIQGTFWCEGIYSVQDISNHSSFTGI